ncbi:MAG: DUF721 domain-containing protein [Thermoleophilia bacterium]|nr:DUF721 domain-containing protein [Thermoleophilia bacterium]
MERIGDEVARTLERAGGGQELARLVTTWPVVVGPAIARNAWPLRRGRDGTLHVATASSTWACELARLAPEILARLRATLGEEAPGALRFRPGPVPEPASPGSPSDRESPRTADPDARARADELAARISDPELRDLVARAAQASLARARSDHRF